MSEKNAPKQRSRHGCLTCRQKRKKCDERRPECSRCERTLSECTWPNASYLSLSGPLPILTIGTTNQSFYMPSPIDSSILGHPTQTEDLTTVATIPSLNNQSESPQALGLRRFSPLVSSTRQTNHSPGGNSADTEEHEDLDSDDVQLVVRRSIDALGSIRDPDFLELCRFYSAFIKRYFYDYSQIGHSIVAVSQQRLACSNSARHAMLSLALLFRSNYEQSYLALALRNHSRDRYQLALETLPADIASRDLSPATKLTGLAEIITYDYYSGNFPFYYQRLRQAASIVQQVIGGKTLDLMVMGGNETIDVRVFAWCDILSSMATSKPTLFNYRSNIDSPQRNELTTAGYDIGLEWLFGCPDILAVILARVSSLRHSNLQEFDKLVEAAKLEQTVLSWSTVSRAASRSLQVVTRLAVQEIWRHTALLYIHQAIYSSNPDHYMVTNSVKQIIRIASTLKSGDNPDCFLAVPYFIAGSFATSVQDRYRLRTRLLGCGNEKYLKDLADTLEELWQETDTTGLHVTWTTKQPPTFIF